MQYTFKYTISIIIILSIFVSPVVALTKADKKTFSDAQSTFDQALALKGQAKQKMMLKAVGLFTAVMEKNQIENGFLYYNIGNAYYEAGMKGKALVNYLRAERLISGMEELKSNIQQVKTDLKIPETSNNWWKNFRKDVFFWHYIIDYHDRKIVFIVSFVFFWLVLGVMIYKKSIIINSMAIMVLFFMICFGVSYGISFYYIHYLQEGVVILHQTETKKGPSRSYESYYQQPLTEGVRFKLLEEQSEWIKIELDNGDRLWVRRKAVELI